MQSAVSFLCRTHNEIAVISHLEYQIHVLSMAQLNADFIETMTDAQAAIASIRLNLDGPCKGFLVTFPLVESTVPTLLWLLAVTDDVDERAKHDKAGAWGNSPPNLIPLVMKIS